MSTKTTFKRIALTVVFSLGLGFVSNIPSANAATTVTLTAVNGTSTIAKSDSTTAASLTIYAPMTKDDSFTVGLVQKSVPAGYTGSATFTNGDSVTAAAASAFQLDTITTIGAATTAATDFRANMTVPVAQTNQQFRVARVAAGDGIFNWNFLIQLETSSGTRVAGTYTYTVNVKVYDNLIAPAGSSPTKTYTQDISITIAALASASKVASPVYSTAVLSQGSSDAGSTVDSTVSVAATAANSASAVVLVTLRNASNAANAQESITATTTAGTIGNGTVQGRSVVLVASAGANTLQIWPDGTAGVATINISTPSVTFAPKTVTFYATAVGSITATVRNNNLGSGSNSGAITAVVKDSGGNLNGGSIYAFSDALTIVSDTGTACTFDAANSRHTCSLTGLAAGTANITLGTISKSVVSAVIPVTVVTAPAAELKIAFNKATYAPGEKAYITVWANTAAGTPVGSSVTNLLATGGITTSSGFSQAIPDMTGVSPTLATKELATAGFDSLYPVASYTVYMPFSGGTVTVTGVGGAGVGVGAGKVVTASAKVSDNAAEALAAVTALASQVSAFITKINAQITTLTDLVMKIQKKVKA